jgi:hypothetical protein
VKASAEQPTGSQSGPEKNYYCGKRCNVQRAIENSLDGHKAQLIYLALAGPAASVACGNG